MSSDDNPIKYFLDLENLARNKLIRRYDKPLSYHDVKMINDILYNEKTHYVEAFKEYLIYEDYNEFLKRYYRTSELNIKLPKILIFYEKYSKIYANYTVIPESKYMYKNIKRKQKMIDQMQNNDINNSDNEEEEEENEEISNTVFSSKVMNSIYNKTLSTLNKSDNGGNSEQSINNFISQINDIEFKVNQTSANDDNKGTKKFQKKIILPVKMNKNFLTSNNTKQNPKSRIQINKNEKFLNNNRTNNNNSKSKNIDIQFTYSKKSFQNDLSNNINQTNNNNQANQNINDNPVKSINQNSNYNQGNKNSINPKANNNMVLINDYMSKHNYSNSNSILNNNNNSIGNNTNNSNTFHSHKNSLNMNNFSKHKLKQNIINQSNKLYNMKENMSESNINNNINNYFSNKENAVNNLKNNNKYKLSLGETLLKQEKIVLSTNTSCSPNMVRENLFSSPNSKNSNIFVNKRRLLLKEKLMEKGYLNPDNNSNIISNNLNIAKKIKPNLLMEYDSVKRKQNIIESKTQKNLNKSNKKKIAKKIKDIPNLNKETDNYVYSEIQSNINQKKPESHRNYYHNKILSTNMKNKVMFNTNKAFKITVGVKPENLSQNQKKSITTHCSPNSSSSNFYYNSQYNKNNNNPKKNQKNALEENNKKKVVNYNIINNIQDNSTQINIYTGSDLYKSLHFHNNSVFNSQNVNQGIGAFSRSPIGRGIGDPTKNKNNNQQNNYFKSQIKGKEKNKYNLNLKKIIHKRILEAEKEKGIISERLLTHNRLLEKLEKYFKKNNKDNNMNNTNIKINYNSNNNKNVNNNIITNSKNINKNNYNRNHILYNNYTKNTNTNSEHNKLITKIIAKNYNNSNDNKQLKNKTNNNTPLKRNFNKFLKENPQNICLSPQNNEQFRKMSKPLKKQKINYNSLMHNLNDLNNFGFDDANKFLINSERNKNYKIIFK